MFNNLKSRNIAYYIFVISAVLIIAFLNHPYVNNSTKIFGYPAYFVETENSGGFTTRTYFKREVSFKNPIHIMAFSYGYEIMDDIADIDQDGNAELLCTCTNITDESVELYVYKLEGQEIFYGHFSPKSIGAEDFYSYGKGSFLTYYNPQDKTMLAQYTTLTGSRCVDLSFEQLEFTKFSDL